MIVLEEILLTEILRFCKKKYAVKTKWLLRDFITGETAGVELPVVDATPGLLM